MGEWEHLSNIFLLKSLFFPQFFQRFLLKSLLFIFVCFVGGDHHQKLSFIFIYYLCYIFLEWPPLLFFFGGGGPLSFIYIFEGGHQQIFYLFIFYLCFFLGGAPSKLFLF